MLDFLVVGAGLAGVTLAHTFNQRNKKFLMVDPMIPKTSSLVAAGIFNPITGKRIVQTWKADLLFPYLTNFYREIEKKTSADFLHSMPIYKPFTSIEEQNHIFSQSSDPAYQKYLKVYTGQTPYDDVVKNSSGGFETNHSGFLDIPTYVSSSIQLFSSKSQFLNDEVLPSQLVLNKDYVQWKGIEAKKVIFCEGYKAQTNPFFNWLPFVLTKGEILHLKVENINEKVILNKNIYILPLGNSTFKAGATYEWGFENDEITLKGEKEIRDKFEKLVERPYSLISHEAGIRPTVKDRRPIIGLHPQYETLGIFNGLGTKGVSIAPYFANQFLDFLEAGKKLDQEVNINRFNSLLYSND
ncbi:MAG TPA: FAD-dependent oxidoreductase [Cytophagaceae bacterium]|jgi:hypothetical protein